MGRHSLPWSSLIKNIVAVAKILSSETLDCHLATLTYWAQVQARRESNCSCLGWGGRGDDHAKDGHAADPHSEYLSPLAQAGIHWATAISHWQWWQENTPKEEHSFDLGTNHKLWSTSTFAHELPLYVLFICLLFIKTLKQRQLPPRCTHFSLGVSGL